MNCNALYDMVRHKEDDRELDLYSLFGFYFNHMPEVDYHSLPEWDGIDAHNPNRFVRIRDVAYTCPDGRRIWRLATVWFDKTPFMVIQNAGREGDDFSHRYITDAVTYSKAVHYLVSLYEGQIQPVELVDPELDFPELTEFYGSNLDNYSHYESRF